MRGRNLLDLDPNFSNYLVLVDDVLAAVGLTEASLTDTVLMEEHQVGGGGQGLRCVHCRHVCRIRIIFIYFAVHL